MCIRDRGTFVLSRKSLILARKLLHLHQTCTQCFPGKACIWEVLKVKVEVNGHVIRAVSSCQKKLLLLAGKWLDRHRTFTSKVPGRACTQNDLKVTVKVKGHVIRALSSRHKNCYISPANGSIATKHSHEGPRKGLHPE